MTNVEHTRGVTKIVVAANTASSNAITQSAVGISPDEWIERHSQTG